MDNKPSEHEDPFVTQQSAHQSSKSDLPSAKGAAPQYPPEEVYRELFDAVRHTLSSGVDRERVEGVVEKVADTFRQSPYSPLLLHAYSVTKDNYILGHIANNTIFTLAFASALNIAKEDVHDIGVCAFCHDIGMIDYTHLFQQDKLLSEEENKMFQQHPLKSAELCRHRFSDKIVDAIMDVHEQVNGGGYPKGKSGGEISFIAKIVAIGDVYEALTHPRNFRKEYSPYEAMKLIIKKKNIVFDSWIVKKFLDYMSIYPVGSLVYLNTGEIAMVTGANRGYPTRSVVQVLLTSKREVNTTNKVINLLHDHMVSIVGTLQPHEEQEILHYLKPRGDLNLE